MSWPMGHISASFSEKDGGWTVGASSWAGAGDYHDGISTRALAALIKNPKTAATSVSLWVRHREVSKNLTPDQAIRALATFPTGVEKSMTRTRTALETWQPKP